MKKLHALTIFLTCLAVLIGAANLFAQTLTASDVTYEGSYDVQIAGNDSTWLQALTSRRVNGELRFLTLSGGTVVEFRLPAMGQKQSTTIRSWSLGGVGDLSNFNGIWWEEAKQRLWVVSAEDYTNVNRDAHVTLVRLPDSGAATKIGTWTVTGVGEKKVYGGVQPSPVTPGKYVIGWGGYTSLVMQGSVASMGPTMFEIPEPTGVSGALAARTLLNTVSSRGFRKTSPINYFDGGDPRQNPSTRPTSPPAAGAQWLSPGPSGNGWFVWGDSYYNTGVYIPGRGFLMIASLCKGACWYQSSTLEFDDRTYELHFWPTDTLDDGVLTRPSLMLELTPPRGGGVARPAGRQSFPWGGNSPTGNIAGATYDSGKLYMMGCPLGPDVFTCRLYQYALASGTPPPPPPPPAPVNCAGTWSAPTVTTSACVSGSQTVTSTRLFTVTTAPANGGASCPVSPEVTSSHVACTPPPPPPTSVYPPPVLSVKSCTVTQPALATSPDGTTGWTMQLKRNGVNFGTADTTAPYGPRTYSSLPVGTWAITAVWTKTGQPTVTTVLGSVVCGG